MVGLNQRGASLSPPRPIEGAPDEGVGDGDLVEGVQPAGVQVHVLPGQGAAHVGDRVPVALGEADDVAVAVAAPGVGVDGGPDHGERLEVQADEAGVAAAAVDVPGEGAGGGARGRELGVLDVGAVPPDGGAGLGEDDHAAGAEAGGALPDPDPAGLLVALLGGQADADVVLQAGAGLEKRARQWDWRTC